ncbi:LOW QUALITY PROTEIN: transmembrane protein 237A [Coregonus clupeaformis]|uniref:LOW QUALITY PROTEIN: transmembrane protein 237A n=1 Tax=Coregonus clupeaformis TaxID=59861 RepID=UPI001E1C5749|nr:LOW QUALITY PROTEIN: transmembrane protein 237A [Coregonus clupeaformis]
MATGGFQAQSARRRDLPPLPQRGQRALPPMSSQDTGDEMPVPKSKRKKSKSQVDGVESPEAEPGMEMAQMGGLSSRRSSEVVQPLTPESQEAAPQRRKRKKKAATIDLEEDQADLVNGDGLVQNTAEAGEEVTKKPKRKKKSKVSEHYVNELDVEDDDIITDAQPPIPQHSLFSAPMGQSQPVGKVFVERSKRFQAADRSDRPKSSDQVDNFMDIQQMWTTKDVSVRVHGGFRVIGLFCHGFLAGYAVWNIIVIYALAGKHLTTLPNLLQQYHSLAYPAQSLFYLLLAISTVSAFDRVNLAKGAMAMREFVTLDPVALASFLYFSALVLSLSQQMTSDRINLYPSANGTLWPPGSEHQILNPWIIVNLVVAVLVGTAWIFISTRPEMDYTEGFLMAMEIESLRPEEKSEMST